MWIYHGSEEIRYVCTVVLYLFNSLHEIHVEQHMKLLITTEDNVHRNYKFPI